MPIQQDKPSLTIVGLQVDAYKRISVAEIHPAATGLVPVRGRNAQGKTSLIGSMLDVLGAVKSGPLTINTESEDAVVVLDLGEIVIRKHWHVTEAGKQKAALSITGADGGKVSRPAEVLKELRGHFADPVAFLSLPPAEQVKVVLSVLGLSEQLDALEAIAATHFDARRNLKRDVIRTKGAVDELELEVGGLPAPPTDGTMGEAIEALKAGKDHNAEVAAAGSNVFEISQRGAACAKRLASLSEQIEDLQQAHHAEALERERLAGAYTEAKANSLALGSAVDIDPLTATVAAFEGAARHQARRELLDQVKGEHEAAKESRDGAVDALTATRNEIDELLVGTAFPDPAMTYDAEAKTLVLNGIPFEQASQAERLKAAASVAMAGNPRIKVLFATDCSLLDDESLAELASLADARGFQVWAEIVDSNAEGAGVWMEDGKAVECVDYEVKA
jgi:hypothetical protein